MQPNKKVATYIAVAIAVVLVLGLIFGWSLPIFAAELDTDRAYTPTTNVSAGIQLKAQVETKDDVAETKDETGDDDSSSDTELTPENKYTTARNLILQKITEGQTAIKSALLQKQATFTARVQTLKTNIAAKQAEVKKQLKDQARAKVMKHVGNINQRFDTILNNISDLRTRIESRIAKLEAAGADVSASIELLTAADAQLSLTKTEVAEAKTKIQNAISGTSAVSNLDLRATIEEAANSIKTTHAAYVAVIKSLKNVVVSNQSVLENLDATTTEDSSDDQ